MNPRPHHLHRHVLTATYKLELLPGGSGYNLLLCGHEIRLDEGIPLDASTQIQVAGPDVSLSKERRLRLKSSIVLPLRLIRG